MRHESCVKFWSLDGIKGSVSLDILKIHVFQLCEFFWILVNNACNTVN